MSEFEKKYYEADQFWIGDMVQDEANIKRIELTGSFVRDEVNSLVDVGCGNGVFLNYLSKSKPHVELTGADRSETALKFVKSNKVQASIENLPFENKSFDCVTCLEVIEHLDIDIFPKALDELARVSKKYIIVSVPYMEILEESHTKCPCCTSIFNCEMHLRSFDSNKIKNLLISRGFNCISTVTTGTGFQFKGHKTFTKIFYPEQHLKWKSPICPVCGYSEEDVDISNSGRELQNKVIYAPSRKLISYLTAFPKLFWPKKRKDYWIIALYQKV